MLKSKILKTLAISFCFVLLISNSIFASDREIKPSEGSVRPVLEVAPDQVKFDDGREPASMDELTKFYSEEVLLKQREIDQFVFGVNAEKFIAKGFKVTNTGPNENHVEVGILPYTEENAEYVYSVFGRELVNVVEGLKAQTLPGAYDGYDLPVSSDEQIIDSDDLMLRTVADSSAESASDTAKGGYGAYMLISIGGLILVAGAILFGKKLIKVS